MDKVTQQLVDETVERVDAFWREHKVPMLLSTLGSIEHGRFSREVKRLGHGLRQFLEALVGDRVMVVVHSMKPTVVGVVPRNEETGGIQDWNLLLDSTGTKSSQRRLHPALWAAFRKPLGDAMERYVQADESVRFTDVAQGQEIQGGIQVDRQFIVGFDVSPEMVYENAVTWLDNNQLDISKFEFDPEPRSKTNFILPSNDLLGSLILALDPQDLQKISIPMEVVAKLRRQAV